ncbi:MAG: non-heme iron oxygenase ferredoxin subunit [Dehalococcoidia bacterium]
MSEFKSVAKVDELAPGELKQIELEDGSQICLANVSGTYYAIGGECTHMGGPLGEGELDGNIVTCPWHSGEFDVTTGEVKGPPPEENAPTYDVRVEGKEIQVGLP